MHKNTLTLIFFIFISNLGFSQKDFIYSKKRTTPTAYQKISSAKQKTLNTDPLAFYKPLNIWANPLLHYTNYYQRSTYFLSNYNWMYNTYYHVNNPWLNNQYRLQTRLNRNYLFNQHYFWMDRLSSIKKNTNKYTTIRTTESDNYSNTKKGRQNGSFNSDYHQHKTIQSNKKSSTTRLKKKY